MKKYLSSVIAAIFLAGLPALIFAQAPTPPIVTQSAKVQINWTDNSNNELNFNIYRCIGTAAVPNCLPTEKLASTGPDVSVYIDTILKDPGNTPLCYAMDASNAGGNSAKSATACIRTSAIVVVKVPIGPSGIRTSIVAVGDTLTNLLYEKIPVSMMPTPRNNTIPYLVALVVMALIGIGGTLAVMILRPLEDNTSLYVSIASFVAPTIASLAAFIKLQETHVLVNGRMDEYRKALALNAALSQQLAREEGLNEGLRQRAAQATEARP